MLTSQQQHKIIELLGMLNKRQEDEEYMNEVIYIPACSKPGTIHYPEYTGTREGCMNYYRVFLRDLPAILVNEAFYYILEGIINPVLIPEIKPAELTDELKVKLKRFWVLVLARQLNADEYWELVALAPEAKTYYNQNALFVNSLFKVVEDIHSDADTYDKQRQAEQWESDLGQ